MMATFELPLPTTVNETQQVLLDGTTYRLKWLWNERDARWYLSIHAQDDTPIVSGMRVVIGWDLLQSVTNLDAPGGAIYFFDLSTDDESLAGADPGLADLGDRVAGYYVS